MVYSWRLLPRAIEGGDGGSHEVWHAGLHLGLSEVGLLVLLAGEVDQALGIEPEALVDLVADHRQRESDLEEAQKELGRVQRSAAACP